MNESVIYLTRLDVMTSKTIEVRKVNMLTQTMLSEILEKTRGVCDMMLYMPTRGLITNPIIQYDTSNNNDSKSKENKRVNIDPQQIPLGLYEKLENIASKYEEFEKYKADLEHLHRKNKDEASDLAYD